MNEQSTPPEKRIEMIFEVVSAAMFIGAFMLIWLVNWKLSVGLFIITGHMNKRIVRIAKKLGVED